MFLSDSLIIQIGTTSNRIAGLDNVYLLGYLVKQWGLCFTVLSYGICLEIKIHVQRMTFHF